MAPSNSHYGLLLNALAKVYLADDKQMAIAELRNDHRLYDREKKNWITGEGQKHSRYSYDYDQNEVAQTVLIAAVLDCLS